MAGSAIVRALRGRKGYGDPAVGGKLLIPSRQELDLLDDDEAVKRWLDKNKPDVVVLAAQLLVELKQTEADQQSSCLRTYV